MNLKKHKQLIITIMSLSIVSFYFTYKSSEIPKKVVSYTEFQKDLQELQIASVNIDNSYTRANEIVYTKLESKKLAPHNKKYYQVLVPSFNYFWESFADNPKYKDIEVKMEQIPQDNIILVLIKSFVPLILLLTIFIWFQRKVMGGMSKNKTELIKPEDIEVSFDDVIGIDEIKEEVQEIVEFLKNPEKFDKSGAKMPRGIILSGAPGTGKTMLAKALAKESGVPFFYCSGSSFVEMYVGLGASRVRSMMKEAKKLAPCIIFIDEIDTVGGKRSMGGGNGGDERESTLNELLTQMDGIGSNSGIFFMGATNRVDSLDKALLRAGRFDRQIMVPLPNFEGRKELLNRLSKKYKISDDFNYSEATRSTSGLSSAEITNLLNEAAIISVRTNKELIDKECFSQALDKIRMGMSNGYKLNEKTKEITAYHEAGHAITGLFLKECDPVHKVNIIPRGMGLGVTMSVPEEDMVLYSEAYLKSKISMLLGGYCAEKKFIGSRTTGASNDIEKVTEIARTMIMKCGLSKNLLPFNYQEYNSLEEGSITLSEDVKHKVFKEIEDLITEQMEVTFNILEEYRNVVEKMVEMLLEKETIGEGDILKILQDCQIEQEKIPSYLFQK